MLEKARVATETFLLDTLPNGLEAIFGLIVPQPPGARPQKNPMNWKYRAEYAMSATPQIPGASEKLRRCCEYESSPKKLLQVT